MPRFFTNQVNPPACIKQDTISLTDCLACSGCVTAEEAASLRPDAAFLDSTGIPSAFIISPQAKKSLHALYRHLPFRDFEAALVAHMKTALGARIVVDTSYFAKDGCTGISSECPAVVLYVERAFPALLPLLSTHRTYQQIAAEYIAARPEGAHAWTRVISIMHCYDKADELRRDGTPIDHIVGAREFHARIEASFHPRAGMSLEEDWEATHEYRDAEVSGLETCINMLRRNNWPKGCGCVELRACSGGCSAGPALIKSDENTGGPGGIQANDAAGSTTNECHNGHQTATAVDGEDGIHFETSPRIFNTPKKKTFAVEW